MMLEAFTCDQMLELIDRAADRVGEPAAGSIRLSGTRCLISFGQLDAARARVSEIQATLNNERLPYIEEGFATYDEIIAASGRVGERRLGKRTLRELVGLRRRQPQHPQN